MARLWDGWQLGMGGVGGGVTKLNTDTGCVLKRKEASKYGSSAYENGRGVDPECHNKLEG